MMIVFWCSLLLILFTFVGYPACLIFLRKYLNKQNLQPSNYDNDISVVMIVCNEASVVEKKIDNIFSQNFDLEKIKLIIVDDASDDKTVEIINAYSDHDITLIKQAGRSGKAAGLNKAMAMVSTELVMFVDARQEITSNAISDLSSWFIGSNNTLAVSGEVKFRNSSGETSGMDAYQKYEKNIRFSESMVSGVPGVSGALYMLKASAFVAIPEDTILDDVLIPMMAAKKSGWIGVDERVIAWDVSSDDMSREKKRKTRTLNGNYQLLFRHPEWCLPGGHALWFQFLSHKVLRLMAPFIALALISSALYLGYSEHFYIFMVGVMTIFGILLYPISIIMPSINKIMLLRIGTSFVALNWFNLLGFVQYVFSEGKTSWK